LLINDVGIENNTECVERAKGRIIQHHDGPLSQSRWKKSKKRS